MLARVSLASAIHCIASSLVAAQIETLAGQVLAAEVDSSASLAAMRAGIERETGVLAEQQRLLILGAPLLH